VNLWRTAISFPVFRRHINQSIYYKRSHDEKPLDRRCIKFLLYGPRTLYIGRRKALGIALTLGALALTYVEMNLKAGSPALYPIMFGAVLLMNAFFAYDGYSEAKTVSMK